MTIYSQDEHSPACVSEFGWPGQAAAHSGTTSPQSSLHPPPPCHTAVVHQRLPGTERHIALDDILPSFPLLLCSSYPQLSQPSTSKTQPKPGAEFIHCICCSFQHTQKSSYLHRRVCHLKIVLHLPLTANDKCQCQARSHLSCGLPQAQAES
jgi:hypothetical protein